MFCFVISKRDYDLSVGGKLDVEPNCVCVGSVYSMDDAIKIANSLPCFTNISIEGVLNKCCYIICNV